MQLYLRRWFRSVNWSCIVIPLLFVSCSHTKLGNELACSSVVEDLTYIHNQMKENSSSYNYSAENRQAADNAFERAKAIGAQCKTEQDYVLALKAYITSYRDPHVNIGFPKISARLLTTGLWMRKLNDDYYIWNADSDPTLKQYDLKRGDKLVQCDGTNPTATLRSGLSFLSVSSPDAAFYTDAFRIFKRPDKKAKDTSKCEFERNGNRMVRELSWVSEPAWNSTAEAAFAYMHPPRYEILEKPWGHFVRLGTMSGDPKLGTKWLEQFVKDAKRLRNDRAVVLDLRFNGGGDSNWGDRWIEALFGIRPDRSASECSIWTSHDNIVDLSGRAEERGKNTGISEQERVAFIKAATWYRGLERNRFLSCENDGRTELPYQTQLSSNRQIRSRFKGHLYVLTNPWCFSSCIMFAENLKSLPGVKVVGLHTGADTLFGDIRQLNLPSGLGQFVLPMKTFSTIGHKASEPLMPDVQIPFNVEDEIRGVDSQMKSLELLILEQTRSR